MPIRMINLGLDLRCQKKLADEFWVAIRFFSALLIIESKEVVLD